MNTERIDLYASTGPVSDVLSFFGRDRLLEEIRRDLMTGQSVIVFGMRKIGKTSLMLRLQQLCDWPVAMVDLQGSWGDDASLAEEVLTDALDQWQAARHLRFPTFRSQTSWQSDDTTGVTVDSLCEAILRMLDFLMDQPGSPGLLLFLDEVDVLTERTSYSVLAAAVRHLATDPRSKGRFALMSAGLEPGINRLEWISNKQNLWFRFFREVLVGPFSHEDNRMMIQSIGAQMGIQYTDGALSELEFASGGHPFLTRQLCSLATRDLLHPGPVDKVRVLRVIGEYAAAPDSYLAWLWDLVDTPGQSVERSLLEELADQQPQSEKALIAPRLSIETRMTRRHALWRLADLGLLSHGPRGWAFTIPLYRQWIRQYVLGLDMTDVVEGY